MNKILKLLSRNTRFWLISIFFIFLTIWVFQKMFFSESTSENISIYSHQKEGNRAFFEYLQTVGVSLSVVYQPSFIWAKKIIQRMNRVNPIKEKRLKYIFVEKKSSVFWLDSETQWFRQWLELGNEIIIFTPDPRKYWEALMLPIVYESNERKKKSKKDFGVSFELGIEKILRNFVFSGLVSKKIKQTQDVTAQKCYWDRQLKPMNIISNDTPYKNWVLAPMKKSGWQVIEECNFGYESFLSKWSYKKGKITFVFSPNIINNEMIADVDNILFIKKAISLSNEDLLIWDAYHHGVSQAPNLWYYVFQTIPGRVFIWLVFGFLFYLWQKNKQLRKYPLPKKRKELQAASLLYFHVLASKFSKAKVVHDTYLTLKQYQKKDTRIDEIEEIKNLNTRKKMHYLEQYFKT